MLVAAVVAGCGSGKGAAIPPDWSLFWQSVLTPDGPILNGLYLTIVISIVAQLLGVLLGIFAALGKMSRVAPFRLVANLYIWFFRGTPLLVQLSMLFFGLQAANIMSWPEYHEGAIALGREVLAGMVILGINEGAYMAEIVRAGILSIDPGQTEAAKSLGMTYRKTMSRIVLPQAARVIVPPLGNEYNNMIKNTSLLSTLGIFELYNTFGSKSSLTYQTFVLFFAACFWYLLLTTVWGVIQSRIENRFGRGTTTSTGPGWRERLIGVGRHSEGWDAIGGH